MQNGIHYLYSSCCTRYTDAPASFSVKFAESYILATTNENDIVVDCFGGGIAIEPVPNYQWLTFVADTNIQLGMASVVSGGNVQYSVNGGNTWASFSGTNFVKFARGSVIHVRTDKVSTSTSQYNRFKMTGRVRAGGDIRSMGAMGNYCYSQMFHGCTSLWVRQGTSGTMILKVPSSVPSNAVSSMFSGTGGEFTGAPAANQTYSWY